MMKPEEVITLLSDHEEAIGNLYLGFAATLFEQKDFWEKCAHEEFHHAQMIRTFRDLLAKGEVRFTGKFNTQVLQTSMRYIIEQIKQMNQKKINPMGAYAVALSIENSLLENRYFDSFTADSAEFQHVKQILMDETEKHRNLVKARWEQKR